MRATRFARASGLALGLALAAPAMAAGGIGGDDRGMGNPGMTGGSAGADSQGMGYPGAGMGPEGVSPGAPGTQPGMPGGRQSQGGAISNGGTFSQLDRNGDGYLSRSEVQDVGPLSNNWRSIDTNGDNRIDQSEFSAFETGSGFGNSMREGHPSFVAPSEGPPGAPGTEERGIPGTND